MPDFEAYNHHPTTPPNLYVRSSQKADLAVDLGLVLVGGAVGGLQEFVEGHGPAETPGFEGSVRQRHVTTSFLTADLGRRASADALTEFEEFQRHDLGVGRIELELVGPDAFAAEEFRCEWFQPVRRGMFEDFRSGDWVVAGEVQGDRFAISVAGESMDPLLP